MQQASQLDRCTYSQRYKIAGQPHLSYQLYWVLNASCQTPCNPLRKAHFVCTQVVLQNTSLLLIKHCLNFLRIHIQDQNSPRISKQKLHNNRLRSTAPIFPPFSCPCRSSSAQGLHVCPFPRSELKDCYNICVRASYNVTTIILGSILHWFKLGGATIPKLSFWCLSATTRCFSIRLLPLGEKKCQPSPLSPIPSLLLSLKTLYCRLLLQLITRALP